MKKITERSFLKKIVVIFLLLIMAFAFIIPSTSHALGFDDIKKAIFDALADIGRAILKAIARVIAVFGDLIESAMNNFMLGTEGFGSAMIPNTALNNKDNWFASDIPHEAEVGGVDLGENIAVENGSNGETIVHVKGDYIETNPNLLGSDSWEIPNILYCPENIFANNIAMLDVNFLNPNEYTAVTEDDSAIEKSESIGRQLHETIKSWYLAFRNIAIVVLLSVLVYLGIRIIISSTAEDKAKHKEVLKDWFVALCLVFVMHFIMAATIMIVNRINALFVDFNNNVYIHYGNVAFRSNFMGVMRFLAQAIDTADAWAYSLIYLVLVFYTISFTIQYLKRVLYIAFYTMISPLVAITYPIDKFSDGKSQAFNKWFKEYVMTMALQPIHLIIYTMLISSALTLSINSPLYALVAIGFLIPAEKFIKSLFGVDSTADKGMGSFASGALAMKGIDMLTRHGRGGSDGGSGKEGKDNDKEDEGGPKIRQQDRQSFKQFSDEEKKKDDNDDNDDSDASQAPKDNQNKLPAGNSNDYDIGEDENVDFSGIDTGWGGPEYTPVEDGENDAEDENIDMAEIEDGENAEEEAAEETAAEEAAEEETAAAEAEAEETAAAEAAAKEATNGEDSATDIELADKEALDAERKYKNMRRRRRYATRQRLLKGAAKKLYGAGKYTAKKGLRAGLRTFGAGLAGTVGLAAGIASGKGIEGAMQMGAAGAFAGNTIGRNAAGLVERGTSRTIRGVKNLGSGMASAKRQYNINKANDLRDSGHKIETRKGEMLDAKEYAKRKELGIGKAKRKEYNEIIKEERRRNGEDFGFAHGGNGEKRITKEDRDRMYEYKEIRGITDDEKIYRGIQMEDDYAGIYDPDTIRDVVELSQTFGQDAFTDEKVEARLDGHLSKDIGDTGRREEVKALLYEVNFGKKNYKQAKDRRDAERAAKKKKS